MRFVRFLTRLPERGALSYRTALPVTKIVKYSLIGYCCPLCPRCGGSLEREYVRFCDRCGQKLCWDSIDRAEIVMTPAGR